VLDEAIAYLDCGLEAQYPGGDHTIVVGRVLDLDLREGARPLLFFRGRYSRMDEGTEG
jgi:flavin reductase (DIM6/NTAB) family NADH-FMN oxidoreductase RutF